jgi:acetyl esterase
MSRTPGVWPLDPSARSFVDGLEAAGGVSAQARSLSEAGAFLADLQSRPVGKPNAHVEDTTFALGSPGDVRVRIVRPSPRTGPLPVVMYFHGGWALCDANTHDRLVREIAIGAQVAVVFVEMGRSPEIRFPVAIERAYAATRHVAEFGSAYNLDGSRLAVAGDGTGGNVAAAVTLMAKDRRAPRISFQTLFCPVTDASCDSESYLTFHDGPWLTSQAMKWWWDSYLPDEAARGAIIASPLRATIDQLRGLPPALIITAENDVLRDEGEAYARKLWEACVRVTATRYLGTIHDFVMLNALADTPAARSAILQATTQLRMALE